MSVARSISVTGLLGLALCAAATDQPPAAVAQALATARVPASAVAIAVLEANGGRPVLRVNDAAPMNPASTMKLLTTFAALELLGPAFRWKTEAYLDGALRDGVLAGNLVLRGGGDPRLDLESFWMLLRALRARGLREVRGDLVLDRSFFARANGGSGAFDGEPYRPYNVAPDALLVNYNALRFLFLPGGERDPRPVRIAVEPHPPALEVINNLRLASGPCVEGRAFREMLAPTFEPSRPRAIFAGRYPASCGERELNVALLPPNDHVGGLMRQLWREAGGAWIGAVREGPAPTNAAPFYVHESPPLGLVVRDVNKHSNNVMARHLFLTLGAHAAGPPGDPDKAAAAVRSWLARKGIAAPELALENGSGLSRIERLSAATLAALLQAAWRSSVMPEFVASLPIVAVDGTMRRRLAGEPIAGQAHIKTGLLADVRAIAGYLLDRAGRRMVVVMIVNHPNAAQTQAAMDELLRWVYERGD
ncbi:MAG: D-alanyl-D-alanine carboxypeptidase/D-alanyl-D-alanine-endopeptidase [Burkholderiales bacterium]|nr:D-alanyl-D-alanine carboxypeptidase/D-alanyl-D-alanine-endopeptidase [Burkholderiales bacterium]